MTSDAVVDPAVRRIADRLREHRAELDRLGVESLALFGSAARGEQGPGSDLDFVVQFRGKPTFAAYADLLLLLEEWFGCPVDLITHKSIRPEIRPQIERDSITVA